MQSVLFFKHILCILSIRVQGATTTLQCAFRPYQLMLWTLILLDVIEEKDSNGKIHVYTS